MSKLEAENVRAREARDTNARLRDERMAEGNEFFNSLVWPGVERLLRPQPDEVLLDVACGNGVTSRRLARAGGSAGAFDSWNRRVSEIPPVLIGRMRRRAG